MPVHPCGAVAAHAGPPPGPQAEQIYVTFLERVHPPGPQAVLGPRSPDRGWTGTRSKKT